MALVIDTNVLLYAANRACSEHEFCVNFLRESVAAGDTCFVPENVIYEFLRVATHPRVFPQPLRASEAVHFLDGLFCVRNFQILGATDRHWESLSFQLRAVYSWEACERLQKDRPPRLSDLHRISRRLR